MGSAPRQARRRSARSFADGSTFGSFADRSTFRGFADRATFGLRFSVSCPFVSSCLRSCLRLQAEAVTLQRAKAGAFVATSRRLHEVEVFGDSPALPAKGIAKQRDPPLRFLQIEVAEIDVQQIDVPRQLDLVAHVGVDDLPCDRQGRAFELSWTSRLFARCSFSYSSTSSRENKSSVNTSPALTPTAIVLGQSRPLVQPFPQNAQPDFAGRHVFHQVQDIVVAEEVGRLERRRLEALTERIAVLDGHAQQIAGASDGARRRLEQREVAGVRLGVGERRKRRVRADCPGRPSPRPAERCAPSSSARPICRWRRPAARAVRRRARAPCRATRRRPSLRECWAPSRPATAHTAPADPACSRRDARDPRSGACSRRSS